jgi:hypothetical protein
MAFARTARQANIPASSGRRSPTPSTALPPRLRRNSSTTVPGDPAHASSKEIRNSRREKS